MPALIHHLVSALIGGNRTVARNRLIGNKQNMLGGTGLERARPKPVSLSCPLSAHHVTNVPNREHPPVTSWKTDPVSTRLSGHRHDSNRVGETLPPMFSARKNGYMVVLTPRHAHHHWFPQSAVHDWVCCHHCFHPILPPAHYARSARPEKRESPAPVPLPWHPPPLSGQCGYHKLRHARPRRAYHGTNPVQ